MYKIASHIFSAILLLFLLNACNDKSRFHTNIKNVPVDIKIERFDIDFFNLQNGITVEKIDDLKRNYADFFDIYTTNVLEFGTIDIPSENDISLSIVSKSTWLEIEKMLQDSMVNVLYQDCLKEFKKTDDIEQKLTTSFRYFHHYFPDKIIPRVLFHFSGFHQTIVTTDSIVSASIEHYLGADYPLYQLVAYQYEIPNMTRTQLPLDITHGWIKRYYQLSVENDKLIDQMIYEGKIRYLLSVFFPDYGENEIMAYTKEQHEWAKRNEKNIWAHIIENRRLFSSNWREIAGFINPGPFTAGFSQQSPGRIGVWIGYRIVKEYAERNKNITLQQLMENNNSLQILEQSGYRP